MIHVILLHLIHSKRVRLHLEKKLPFLSHSAVSFSDSFRTVRYDFKPFHTGTYQTDLLNAGFEDTSSSKVIEWGQTDKSWNEISQFELEQLCHKKCIRHYARDFTKWSFTNATPVWGQNSLWGARISPLNIRPILGVDVGIALLIAQYCAHQDVSLSLALIDLCIAHCVYGRDRLLDQTTDTDNLFYYTTYLSLAVTCCAFTSTGRSITWCPSLACITTTTPVFSEF